MVPPLFTPQPSPKPRRNHGKVQDDGHKSARPPPLYIQNAAASAIQAAWRNYLAGNQLQAKQLQEIYRRGFFGVGTKSPRSNRGSEGGRRGGERKEATSVRNSKILQMFATPKNLKM